MKIVSVVFHPLLMATYSCVLLYLFVPEIFIPFPFEAIPYFIISVFITTFIVPVISLLFLKLSKRISSLEMSKREERSFPFFSISAFYGVTTYLFYSRMNIPKPLLVMMISVTLLIFIIFLVTIKYKISVHSAGIWGVAGIFSSLALKYLSTSFILPLGLIFLAAGLTTTSRLYLGNHTPQESWSGIALGFIVCFTGVLVFG